MNEKEIIIAASLALSLTLMLFSFPKRQNIARAIATKLLAYADGVDYKQLREIEWRDKVKYLTTGYLDLVETKNK